MSRPVSRESVDDELVEQLRDVPAASYYSSDDLTVLVRSNSRLQGGESMTRSRSSGSMLSHANSYSPPLGGAHGSPLNHHNRNFMGSPHPPHLDGPSREFESVANGYDAGSFQGHQSGRASGTSTPAAGLYNASFNTSYTHMALKYRKPFAQRVLAEGEETYKPWKDSKKRKSSDRKAYWIFVISVFLGISGAAVIMYFAYASVPKDKYCLVMEDNFDSPTLNKDIWFHEMETGGFGNGEFEWTTDSTNNSYIEDGKLYIVPTLTSDALGEAAITNGYSLNLTESGTCTNANKTDQNCAVRSNSTTGVVLPPIQSARLMTNFSRSIKYGRVEVKAKMPTGDWIWPAIWMMPKDSVYGQWPRSGEIDIFESKGNRPKTRDSDGYNKMHSTLHFGPNYLFDGYGMATKVRNLWRNFYNQEYHTFGLEWTEDHLYTWEHSPVFKNLEVDFKKQDFWDLGRFPSQMANGTLLSNPWADVRGPSRNAAPFDQQFYLILNVAVGGTNGYFKDGQGDSKPWSNDAANARSQFWAAKDQWLPSWPKDPKQRGMAIESVKMWQKC